jgi:hypothetical protein
MRTAAAAVKFNDAQDITSDLALGAWGWKHGGCEFVGLRQRQGAGH